MADLDDFFSKRDKKKKSKKDEQFVVDDIAKILDAKTKERKNMETNKSNYVTPASDEALSEYKSQGQEGGDDEWKELEDNKPDYTGLKIQELILDDEEEEETKEVGPEDESSKEGAWSMISKKKESNKQAAAAAAVIAAQESSDVVFEEPKSKSEAEAVVAEGEEPATAEQDGTAEIPTPDQTAAESSESSSTGAGASEPKKYVPPHERMKQKESPAPSPSPAGVTLADGPVLAPVVGSAALKSSSSGAYVPPSKRGLSGPSSSLSSKPRKAVAIPKITDEELFPSLEQALGKS